MGSAILWPERNSLFSTTILLQGEVSAPQTVCAVHRQLHFGIAGFFDVMAMAGRARQKRDFGQTLAVWGVPDGLYLVLLLFGPNNLRDSFGYGGATIWRLVTTCEYATATSFGWVHPHNCSRPQLVEDASVDVRVCS